jgi:hypothetical protein
VLGAAAKIRAFSPAEVIRLIGPARVRGSAQPVRRKSTGILVQIFKRARRH